ncbi:hypothetical protein P152DRAFT_473450 [Eremomyces bilateralis CBS 781.70]|uniref:Uncharacterized protein n=1 Tax=Eremomyces bilateralis CBS 781.70 TaxID=1392243 RepID=A0A6G1G511_9PEZI|nr:uncharacterized protein P152DRAFT_473450 [Eremomyces bilateralis CBS 781.70]KAF1812919.1 hypothetical protein P152DRAFT_473450 [Eremomyces bilateralis CBS 781.70]
MARMLGRSKSFRHIKKDISQPLLIASDAVSRDDLIDVRRDLAPPRTPSPLRPKTSNGITRSNTTALSGLKPPPHSQSRPLKIKTESRVYDFPTPGTGTAVYNVPPPNMIDLTPEIEPHPGRKVPIGVALGSPTDAPDWRSGMKENGNLGINRLDRPRSISAPSPSREYFPQDAYNFQAPGAHGSYSTAGTHDDEPAIGHGIKTVIEADQPKPKLSRWKSIGGLFAKRPNHTPNHTPRTMYMLDEPVAPSKKRAVNTQMPGKGLPNDSLRKPTETMTPKEPKSPWRSRSVKRGKPGPARNQTHPTPTDMSFLTQPAGVDGRLLDVSIPKCEMERYSVMFNHVLGKPAANETEPPLPASSSLLARRNQANVEQLKPASGGELEPINISPSAVRPRRAATSPSSQPQGYTLFPTTPGDKIRGPSGLQRSATTPAPRPSKHQESEITETPITKSKAQPRSKVPPPRFPMDVPAKASPPTPQFAFDPAEDILWTPPDSFLSSSRLATSGGPPVPSSPATGSTYTDAETEYEYEYVFEGPGATAGDAETSKGAMDHTTKQWKDKIEEEEPQWEMMTTLGKDIAVRKPDRNAQIVPVVPTLPEAETHTETIMEEDRSSSMSSPTEADIFQALSTAALPSPPPLAAPAPLNIVNKTVPISPIHTRAPPSPQELPTSRYMDSMRISKAPSPPPEADTMYRAPQPPPTRLPPSPPQETYPPAPAVLASSENPAEAANMKSAPQDAHEDSQTRPNMLPVPRVIRTLATGTMTASPSGTAPSEKSKKQYERVKSIVLPLQGTSRMYTHATQSQALSSNPLTTESVQARTIRVVSPGSQRKGSDGFVQPSLTQDATSKPTIHPPRTSSRMAKPLSMINKYMQDTHEDAIFESDHEQSADAASNASSDESEDFILPLQAPEPAPATVGIARQLSLTRARSTSRRYGPGARSNAAGNHAKNNASNTQAAANPAKMVAGPGIVSVQMRQIKRRDPAKEKPEERRGEHVALTPTLVDVSAARKSVRGVVEGVS